MYSRARLIRTANARKKSCELSEPILRYVFTNSRELCPEQVCELSRVCELARVKLSGLYCTKSDEVDLCHRTLIAQQIGSREVCHQHILVQVLSPTCWQSYHRIFFSKCRILPPVHYWRRSHLAR